MKKRNHLILIVWLAALLIPSTVFAQQEGEILQLSLIRNFGYGGIGKIQGNFTLRIVDPPAELDEVSFYMDGELIEVVSEAPFLIKFHTGDFQDGDHQMSASGLLDDGNVRASNTITKTFLSSETAWSETQQVILPLLLGVGALTLLGIGVPFLLGRKKEFIPGQYGPAGGAVCPRCSLPFSRPYLAPNMLVGKMVRCPHCGKVSILPMASRAQLDEAERRYRGAGDEGPIPGGEEDIRKMIDESRFEG